MKEIVASIDQCLFSNTRFHNGQKVVPVAFRKPVEKDGTTSRAEENVSAGNSHQGNGDHQIHHRTLERKFTPKDCSKSSMATRPSTGSTNTSVDQGKRYQKNVVTARGKVMEILREFRAYCNHTLKMDKENNFKRKRVDFLAAKMIKKKLRCHPAKPFSGSVPGVEIGDKFHYRMELNILGLHLPSQGGIGYMQHRGKFVATSVVDSGGYDNYMASQDTLVYCGQGGNNTSTNMGLEVAEDQELKGGNLALFNSIRAKNPVRVIRGSKVMSKASTTYLYDGLYTVEKMWEEKGLHGKRVYRFKLVKMPGSQPSC